MDGIDPDTLLEWLQTGFGEERDLQLMALEQLCMLLLMSDNIDRCFESCPPRTFLPPLCKIFLDDSAPENVLEVTARAITYYLDVSNECTRRITQVEGAVKAICNRLAVTDLEDRTSKDLAEQCVKLLEHVCQRETLAVYDAGGLNAMLTLVTNHSASIHKDTLHSAMSVVTRLCGKMEPTDGSLPKCTQSLGTLLTHDDAKVSECSLRCFAALTDRFMRKQMDPVGLATHSDLIPQLLAKLESISATSPSNTTSIVLSLLSNLCRGSAVITEQVLSSARLISGLTAVLSSKEERSVCDGLRLADLFMLLLCEGRTALPASSMASVPDSGAQGSTTAEKAHRQLIDVIRQKDTAALIEAVETGGVDVNYTDDVGQTLLNWAAAFGSLEMVVYLCEKGADVNKGHKSSSLHYAASFGRPDVTKLLLQRGANADLRDEDGKTALDKARERTEEDYLAVATILETPSMYMATVQTDNKKESDEKKEQTVDSVSTTMDRHRVLTLIRRLIPVFCESYQKAQSAVSKRSSLSLLRKAVQHWAKIDLQLEDEGLGAGSIRTTEDEERQLADSIMGVIMCVLELNDDTEAQEQALLVIDALLNKDSVQWVEELIRLGVFEKIESMASELEATAPPPPFTLPSDDRMGERSVSTTPSLALSDTTEGSGLTDERERERASMLKVAMDVEESAETPPPSVEVTAGSSRDDCTELSVGTPYRWKEWRLVRGPDSLFFWADPLAIEFPYNPSVGIRFLIDGHLRLLSAEGKDEECSSAEKEAFLIRFRSLVGISKGVKLSKHLCMVPSSTKKNCVPGWELMCHRSAELIFKSTRSPLLTLKLNDELAGFTLEYGESGKKSVAVETLLDSEFHTGWTAYSNCARSARLRSSMQTRRVQDLALDIWRKHLKEAKTRPREALLQLQNASHVITEAVKSAVTDVSYSQAAARIENVKELVSALECVRDAALDERRLSTYEVSTSGLVPAITSLLRLVATHPQAYPSLIFKETFRNSEVLSSLACRMVKVLEATEKFPLYLYDTPGGSAFGLQLLSKRIRMKLAMPEQEGEEKENGPLLNRTGRVLKSEPLTTVMQLKHFLLRMVAKQWFDRERSSFAFVQEAKEAKKTGVPLRFSYTSDFDDQGILYWLGTNGRTESEWTNPGSVGVVGVYSSDHPRQPFGRPDDIFSRDSNPLNCHTSDDKNANFTMDLGVYIRPTNYTMRHARGYGRSALRSWLLQGSMDGVVWEVVSYHRNDSSLGDTGSTASWVIEGGDSKGPYRFFRIAQNGENSSGQTYYLSLSGFEIYGLVLDASEGPIKSEGEKEKKSRLPIHVPSTSSRPSLPTPESLSGKKSRRAKHDVTSAAFRATNEQEIVDMLPLKYHNNRFSIMSVEEFMATTKLSTTKLRTVTRRVRHNSELIGVRMHRGPDWRWGEQDGGKKGEGRVVGVGDGGWVDVEWDNGTINSYRFGVDNQYDIVRVDGKDRRGKGPEGGSLALGALSSLGVRAKRASAAAAVSVKSCSPSSSATPSTSTASSSSTSTITSSTIGKKSMSTTNLVEDRVPVVSVSATGQAASAESLQHQTPSLENLLANYSAGRSGHMETLYDEAAEASVEGDEEESMMDGGSFMGSGDRGQESIGDGDIEEAKEAEETMSETSEGKNLSVSAPHLANASTEDEELLKALEAEEDEDEGEGSSQTAPPSDGLSLLMDSLQGASDRSLLERLREAASSLDYSMEALLSDSPSSSTSSAVPPSSRPLAAASSGGKKAAAAIKTKMTSYADVLKSVMQQMLEPSTSTEGDDMDDEDMYEDVEVNEDELEEEFSTGGMPVESLASLLGGGKDLRVNFRHLTQLMLGHRGGDRVNRDAVGRDRSLNAIALRQWDDEFVLKCTFNALIPAFDPRPGRTNAKQTVDVELPKAGDSCASSSRKVQPTKPRTDACIRLFLTGPNLPHTENVTVEMTDEEASIFKYVQKIANHLNWSHTDNARRIWEPTYTLTYEDAARPMKTTVTKMNTVQVIPENVAQVLRVLTLLEKVGKVLPDCELSPSIFISEKITQKLRQELCDPLVVASGALPEWCEKLVIDHACLFSVETRETWLQATSFGVSRSIVWLQGRRDAALERTRGSAVPAALSTARRDDQYEYRLGRIKHERIKVSRSEDELMEQAIRLLRFHADRKAVLEIEYTGEEGTGLGPTLEFYALVAAEFQKKALAIWMCDDLDESQLKMEESELDLGEGKKPPGYYVRRASGLFPAPLPPDSQDAKRASELFKILGIFLAKVLQDGRLVDLPLARPFLKLVSHPLVSFEKPPRMEGILDLDDFEEVHPVKGRFLKELTALVARKRGIEADNTLNREAKRRRLDELSICINGTKCSLEQLGLNFTVNPPSSVFTYDEMELVEGGADIDVTIENVDLYVDKCTEYYLNTGIRQQVVAFRQGFDRVFPLASLRAFSSDEVQRLISGEQSPEWTKADIINYTDPKLGYTRESPVFLRLVDVLFEMTGAERKRFVQFATGCSNLPPGGLANLHPRLTIVRKVESGDGSYPSVNTCVHYLKLPEYSSAEIMRERLLTACNEKGFHLN